MSDPHNKEFENFGESARDLPLLEQFDRVIASLPPGDPVRLELLNLRPDLTDREETIIQARQMIETWRLDYQIHNPPSY